MRRRLWSSVWLLSLALLSWGSEDLAQGNSALTGTWQAQENGLTITLLLYANGTGELDGTSISYIVKGNVLSILEDGFRNNYTYVMNGSTLALSGGDLEREMVFTRPSGGQDGGPPAGLGARRNQGQQREEVGGTAAGSSTGNTGVPKGLIGKWQGPQDMVEIKKDGSMLVGTTPYRYKVEKNVLTMIGSDGQVLVPFQLNGDLLQVVYNGQLVELNRVTQETQAAAAGQGATGGAMALVGKWCYVNVMDATSGGGRMTSECITIYANGTFEFWQDTYNSNPYGSSATNGAIRGTWTATENTLTANIQGQGTRVYQLVKRNHPKNVRDPMICLDGRCYVTYGPKNPW